MAASVFFPLAAKLLASGVLKSLGLAKSVLSDRRTCQAVDGISPSGCV